jgi:hypothetical protein
MKDHHREQVSPPQEKGHRGCTADETAHCESPTPDRHMKRAEAEQRKCRRKPEAAGQRKEPVTVNPRNNVSSTTPAPMTASTRYQSGNRITASADREIEEVAAGWRDAMLAKGSAGP